jgi:hypothetical protein
LLTEIFAITILPPPPLHALPDLPLSRRETLAQVATSCHQMMDFFTPLVTNGRRENNSKMKKTKV